MFLLDEKSIGGLHDGVTLVGKTAFYDGRRRKILEEASEVYLLRGRECDKKELVATGHFVQLEGVGHLKIIDCCVKWGPNGKCIQREEKEEWIGYWISVDLLKEIS